MDGTKWRADGVTVIRAASLRSAGAGRATAFEFTGTGTKTWIGTVTLEPKARNEAHHHGRHEVAVYVVKGRGQIRWGERLDFATEVGPGDFIYFAPYVPHQEANLDANETLDFVVVRSDSERVLVSLDIAPVEQAEQLF